jgi:hypothetical protein
MTTGRSVGREIVLVAAVGVIVALVVAVGLSAAIKVTLSSIDDAHHSHLSQTAAGKGSGGVAGASLSGPGSQQKKPTITLRAASATVRRHEIVPLTGRYVAHSGTKQSLHVQVRRHRRWITFPLPAVSNQSGRFKAFVELGHRGVNRLRVIDRSTGHVSNVTAVTVL